MKRTVASRRSGLAVWAAGCLMIVCALLAPPAASATDPTYGWTKSMGGTTGGGNGLAVVTDTFGNVYTTGDFFGEVNFAADFGGSDIKTANGGIFVTRINADGSYGWTRAMGVGDGTGGRGRDLAVDPDGNIYVTGVFGGTVDFAADFGGCDIKNAAWDCWDNTYDPEDPEYECREAYPGRDIFVTRINPNGSYGWTRTFRKSNGWLSPGDYDCGISTDSHGRVYVLGFIGYPFGQVNYAEDFGGSDIQTAGPFLTRINPDGSYGWTKKIAADEVYDLAVDTVGNILIAGSFIIEKNFGAPHGGSDLKSPVGEWDAFVTRIKADGSYGWTKTMGGPGNDYALAVSDDKNGNVYVTGSFGQDGNTVNFGADFGESDLKISAGDYDIFVTRIKADGAYGWTRTMGGTGEDFGSEVYADAGGNVFVTGVFAETVDFAADFGGSDLKTSAGYWDIFVTSISRKGDYGWTRRMGGTNEPFHVTYPVQSDYGSGISQDHDGNLYVTGGFNGTVDFAEDFGGSDVKTSIPSAAGQWYGAIYLTQILVPCTPHQDDDNDDDNGPDCVLAPGGSSGVGLGFWLALPLCLALALRLARARKNSVQ